MTDANAAVTAKQGEITTLDRQLTTLAGQLATLNAGITKAESEVVVLQGKVGRHNTTMVPTLSSHGSRPPQRWPIVPAQRSPANAEPMMRKAPRTRSASGSHTSKVPGRPAKKASSVRRTPRLATAKKQHALDQEEVLQTAAAHEAAVEQVGEQVATHESIESRMR